MSKNQSPLQEQNTFLGKVKKLIGVEPGTRLQPMVAYNSAIFFSNANEARSRLFFWIFQCFNIIPHKLNTS